MFMKRLKNMRYSRTMRSSLCGTVVIVGMVMANWGGVKVINYRCDERMWRKQW